MTRFVFVLFTSFSLFGLSFAFAQDDPEDAQVCTLEYAPVCTSVDVECVTAPCPPVLETFGNMCQMENNDRANYLYDGECSDDRTRVYEALSAQLSDLSDVDPVLGGDRYLVSVTFLDDNQLDVVYEDGHIQESMDLRYVLSDDEVLFFTAQAYNKDQETVQSVIATYLERFSTQAEQLEVLETLNEKVDSFLDSEIAGKARYYLTLIGDVATDFWDELSAQ